MTMSETPVEKLEVVTSVEVTFTQVQDAVRTFSTELITLNNAQVHLKTARAVVKDAIITEAKASASVLAAGDAVKLLLESWTP